MSELIQDLAPFIGFAFEFVLVGIIYVIFKIIEIIDNWKKSRKKIYKQTDSPYFPTLPIREVKLYTHYPIFCNEKTFSKIAKSAITPS